MPRFISGMSVLPPFLLLKSIELKAALVICFAILTLLSGRRIRWKYFTILGLSVCFFHLLMPWGKVLAQIGPLKITAGALQSGLTRFFTLAGTIFISLATVNRKLKLPGTAGNLLGRTFYHFENLVNKGKGISFKIDKLDNLLMTCLNPAELNNQAEPSPSAPALNPKDQEQAACVTSSRPFVPSSKSPNPGWLPGAAFSIIVWGIWGYSLAG